MNVRIISSSLWPALLLPAAGPKKKKRRHRRSRRHWISTLATLTGTIGLPEAALHLGPPGRTTPFSPI